MHRTRKVLAALLSFSMLFALVVPMTVSAKSFPDVPNTHKYYYAINTLSEMGVINGYDDGTFQPEGQVTRAEFTKMITVALGVNIVPSSAGTGFTDVAVDHWAAGNIAAAAGMGIINGMGDGTFLPEDNVTYEQAVKMVVAALGYNQRALAQGGYPAGYMAVGASIGVLKGISDGVATEPAMRGTIAQLIYNMLDVEQVDPTTGATKPSINESSDKTTSKGQVIAIRDISIDASRESNCKNNEIQIYTDGYYENFEFGNALTLDSAKDLLGMQVQFTYEEPSGSDGKVLVSISKQKNRNVETVIEAEDINQITDTNIEYMDPENDGEPTDMPIDSGAYILYNGMPTSKDLSDIELNEGRVVCLDSRGAGSADVVFVQSYTNYYVNSIDTKNYKIVDKYDNTKTATLDEKDRNTVITFKKGTSSASFSTIRKGDVVSVAESDVSNGKKVIDVLISDSLIRGTVDEVVSGEDEISINDKQYKIASNYAEAIEDDPSLNIRNLGTSGTFYLDAFGKIAAADITAAKDYTYGYLMDVKVAGGIDGTMELKIYPVSNSGREASIYTLDSKITLDGTPYDSTNDIDSIQDALKASADAMNKAVDEDNVPVNADFAQLIKFDANSSRVIDRIITNQAAAAGESEANSLIVDSTWLEEGLTYTGSYKFDGGKVITNSSTKVLFVPNDRTEGEYKSGSFKTDNPYHIQVVDSINNGAAKVVLVYEPFEGSDFSSETPLSIIASNVGSKSVDGVPVDYLTVIENGAEKEYLAEMEGDFDGLAIGDVVRFSESGGYVDKYEVVAKAGALEAGDKSDNPTNPSRADYRVLIGTVLSYNDGLLRTVPAFVSGDELDTTNVQAFTVTDSTDIYLCDSTQGSDMEVEEGDESLFYGFDNNPPDMATKVLCYTSNDNLKLVIVYK